VNDPRVEALLAGITFEEADINEARRFGNRLVAAADRWKLRSGFGERGRVSKSDAARMFAQAFPATAILLAADRRRDGSK
jgi:hypothetical protein